MKSKNGSTMVFYAAMTVLLISLCLTLAQTRFIQESGILGKSAGIAWASRR